jgi:L-amino acid N-acyltransferase YncA
MESATRQQPERKIRIRQSSDADRAAILAMYETFDREGLTVGMPPETSVTDWLDELATSPNFVAVDDGDVVGHGFVRPEDGTGEVAVFVHQDYRGRGIGRRLLATVIEEARHQHLGRVWGMTESKNSAMFGLARSLGFLQANDPHMFWLVLEPPDESRLVITSPPLPQA